MGGAGTGASRDDGIEGEQRLVAALFGASDRGDPSPLFDNVDLPGCRFAVAEAMLRDPRLVPPAIPPSDRPLWQMFARWLISLDGERHARVRRHFQKLFTPRSVEGFRDVVERRATTLLDALAPSGRMDVVADFARPLPFSVIVDILGVPSERHAWLAERMLVLGVGFARQNQPEYHERTDAAVSELVDFFSELLDERAERPQDDLLSVLAADMPTDPDSRPDLVANCIFFIEAGHATTTSLIAGGILLLLTHSDALARLRAEPELVPVAVEEMLRLVTPVTMAICRAVEDVEIHGYRFPAGTHRRAFLAAANRDPEVFPEPTRFDPARKPRHLSFSAGAHFCLGAPLARLHGEIAIAGLLRRLPNLRLNGAPEWRGLIPLHELEHLPVAWDARLSP